MVAGMTDWLDVSSTATRIAYTATADQTVFDVPFEFYDENDLAVYVNDTLQTLSDDYATSGALEQGGGSITFTSGLSAGDSVVIELSLPYALDTHIPTSGDIDVAAINLQFSKFTSMLKQLVATLPRSIRQPTSDADDLSALPVASSRAGKYLGFDADGDVAVLAAVSASVSAKPFWETILSTTDTTAEAQEALGITNTTSYAGLSNYHFCR